MLLILEPKHYRLDPKVAEYMGTIRHITRCNLEQLLDARAIQIAMRSGAWWNIRRAGATKVWVTQPNRIRIPYKFGMYGYGAITETDFIELPEYALPPIAAKADPKCEHCEWLEMALDHSRRFA